MDSRFRQYLLHLARTAILDQLAGRYTPLAGERDQPDAFGGAFVTLRRQKILRGCMGTFQPQPSLAQTVEAVARLACCDPRFTRDPVTAQEMPDLGIEISVLSPLELTGDPRTLRLGHHGLWVRRGASAGCFLPEVAVEHGWSVEELLGQCCSYKAGLSPDAWEDPQTQVYFFTTEVLREAEPTP